MAQASKASPFENAFLSPMLSVRRGASAVDFYQAAFDATVLFRMDDPVGAVVAHMAVGKSEFWVSDEAPEHGNFSPESMDGTSARMILVLDNPDAAFAKAVQAGARVVSQVTDEPYGWRIGRIVDPFGHVWEIGKPL